MKKQTTRFFKNKLVRDNIVELLKKEDVTSQSYMIEDDNEFLDAITQKLIEELQEVFASENNDELLAELADFEDVLELFKKFLKIDQKEIEAKKAAKKAINGGFEKRVFLEYIDVPNSNKTLIEKYTADAERQEALGLDDLEFGEDEEDEADDE